jgi:hypothetical protein
MLHQSFLPVLEVSITLIASFILIAFYSYAFKQLIQKLNENLSQSDIAQLANTAKDAEVKIKQTTQVLNQPNPNVQQTKIQTKMMLPSLSQVTLLKRRNTSKTRISPYQFIYRKVKKVA